MLVKKTNQKTDEAMSRLVDEAIKTRKQGMTIDLGLMMMGTEKLIIDLEFGESALFY